MQKYSRTYLCIVHCARIGRVSVFTTEMGDITMMLEGDDGTGLDVVFDGEKSDESVSPQVALDEQEALERQRQLAQLVKELAEDVRNYVTFTIYTTLDSVVDSTKHTQCGGLIPPQTE